MFAPSTLPTIVQTIIKKQEEIIGPLAWDQAKDVEGIVIRNNQILINGTKEDPNAIITHLVQKYADFFGRASVEVCKEAVHEAAPDISPSDLPDILK